MPNRSVILAPIQSFCPPITSRRRWMFSSRVVGRLREQAVLETNLDRIWRDVLVEREDPGLSKRRRLEALLGRSADEVDDNAVEQLVADGGSLGEEAVEGLAAERAQGGALMNAEALERIAASSGVEVMPRDAVRLAGGTPLPSPREAPAWRIGSLAARALRAQQRLGERPISNERLAEMTGIQAQALARNQERVPLSFALDRTATSGRIVLRSRYEEGRRFALAQLTADRIVSPPPAFGYKCLHFPAKIAAFIRGGVLMSF